MNNQRDQKRISLKLAILVIVIVVVVAVLLIGLFLNHGFWRTNNKEEERPRIIIGLSKIELKGGEIVGTQVDRVIRDIAWENSPYDKNVSPDRIPINLEDLVPYMEGERAKEMMQWADVKILPLTPAIGKHKEIDTPWPDNPYYAADGKGNFPFLIEPTKVEYETVFSVQGDSQGKPDLILPDTHGFNMIAEQAYLHKDQLYMVMACMDFESKAEAALYLAKQGLNIYAPCDRFANMLMNYKEIYPDATGTILGSAPIRKTDFGAVIGDQPVIVYLDETVVIQYTEEGYPDQYCDTPWRYFERLEKEFNLDMEVITVTANIGETGKIVEIAEINDANVIGVRIYNEDDYMSVAIWLKKNSLNRAILFHSVAYEPGVKLFKEFPKQTTFGDLQPKIIE